MPLPPALAAKLAKRGIIQLAKSTANSESTPLAEEEIIAEDYDDTPQQEPQGRMSAETFDPYQGYSGCPNKWNVYHECTPNCRDIWQKSKSLDMDYDKLRIRMLAKHPLPDHWQEILDPGIGRYYYWNTDTDLVSWLPPGHPKCQVSRSAASLRKQMISDRKIRVQEEKQEIGDTKMQDDEKDDDDDSDHSKGSDSESDSDDDKPPPPDTLTRKDKIRQQQIRDRERRGKRAPARDDLDPMDPAAYGECPRGNWSSGLPTQNEARTGVDTTANGPLFQMRPYPNPGAILRANAANTPGPNKPA